ncbi:MAG: acylneuraminate cytidylyltransferase family protein [Blastocatellia bacterium]
MNRILGLIPARGGSKGVPRKNIRILNGKPLLAYTAEAGLAAKTLTRVVLSTEDEEIAKIGRDCGLDVPFMRPANLAEDNTPSLAVVRHALETLSLNGDNYDAICLLQPTNPFRRSDDIDECVRLFNRTEATCVISVLQVPHEHNPKWVYFNSDDGRLAISTGDSEPIPRRQDLPTAFHRDGSVYVSSCETVLGKNSLYGDKVFGYEIDNAFSANIDTEQDWQKAEQRLS